MSLVAIWSLPFVGAFNGWITTHFAIRMLFRPRRPWHIGPFQYVAPLPKRQREIAERIGAIVENELLNYEDIREQIATPEFLEHAAEAVESQIGEMLADKRASLPSLVQKLLTDDLLKRARRLISREVANELPELIERMLGVMSEKVSIRRLIAEKVAAFELDRLEEVIFSLAARELRLIEGLCGGLGFLIGCVQLLISL